MTDNVSSSKHNFILQRHNCAPYLKACANIPENCTAISAKTFQNRSMICRVSSRSETDWFMCISELYTS